MLIATTLIFTEQKLDGGETIAGIQSITETHWLYLWSDHLYMSLSLM